MANALIVQHIGPEGAFAIGDALRDAGVELDTRRVYAGDAVPTDVAGLDGLVVMGGPMSAISDASFATRRSELALLRDALHAGIPTLGVCLGAQLLALAGGSSVFPGAKGSEIGWAPVTATDACKGDELFAECPAELVVLHWHGDTFELPIDAQRLFMNETYPNQGFRIGERAWGVQFHLEVDEDAVDSFLVAFALDAETAPGGKSAIKEATARSIALLAPHRDVVVRRFARLVSTRVKNPSVSEHE
jgi:GMP synthase-like glutamine amidotransferase